MILLFNLVILVFGQIHYIEAIKDFYNYAENLYILSEGTTKLIQETANPIYLIMKTQ